MPQHSKIIADGFDNYRRSRAYQQQVVQITSTVNQKYQLLIQNEKKLIKRIMLKIKRSRELQRKLDKLSAFGNLYLTSL